jgi:hypothetical protein
MRANLTKLLKLKAWLTVPDAARHLGILFGEDVTEADVLRLALDGHLKLSVDFVNRTTAQCGKIIRLADAKVREVPNLTGDGVVQLIEDGVYLGRDRVFSYSEEIKRLEGVWDLAMVGAERIDVEHKYHYLTDGPAVELFSLEGPFVNLPNGMWARIVEYSSQQRVSFDQNKFIIPRNDPNNYHPATSLPSDAVLVVRTSELQVLEALSSEPDPPIERPIERRERTTLLVIIAALAKLAKVDIAKASKTAAAIESETLLMGTRVAARTIEGHLKRIPEALQSKADD